MKAVRGRFFPCRLLTANPGSFHYRTVVLNLFSTAPPFSHFRLFHAPLTLICGRNKCISVQFINVFILRFCNRHEVHRVQTQSLHNRHNRTGTTERVNCGCSFQRIRTSINNLTASKRVTKHRQTFCIVQERGTYFLSIRPRGYRHVALNLITTNTRSPRLIF